MIAAIYARTATEHGGESVTRQVAHATAYATRKGWTVNPQHVFIDAGISGFGAARPALARLMRTLRGRAPFQVLVMREESRLGREATMTTDLMTQITDADVRMFFYLDDREGGHA